jgi:hypothetical protein
LKRSVFAGEAGEKYLPAPQEKTTSYVYDSFNPEARRFVWAQMREGYQKYGIKTFWLDADEPESFLPVAAPGKRFFNDEGRGWKSDNEVGMGWVQKHHRMIHDGEKTVFLSHFYIKMMVLPRQARDTHRGNSKKQTVLSQGCYQRACSLETLPCSLADFGRAASVTGQRCGVVISGPSSQSLLCKLRWRKAWRYPASTSEYLILP